MPGEHAVLSASSAFRWIHCPASVKLTAGMADTAGEAAAEGTLAHAICELRLRKQYSEPISTRTYNNRLKKLQADDRYSAEMLEGAELYAETVDSLFLGRSSKPYVAIEQRVDYSAIAPEGFGTADCILIGDNILDIIDYKYGKGVSVDAENNPQLMLYALGAISRYGMLYSVGQIRLTVVQPRAGGVKDWTVTREDLEAWGESIKPIAQSAFDGTGPCVCGPWCEKGFCRLRATCRVRNEALLNADFKDSVGQMPPELTDAEIGAALSYATRVKAWLSDLEAYALSACLSGKDIPGWKAVEGRSNRTITDVEKAFEELIKNGTDEAQLYERKPLTLTALEKLVGAKKLPEIIGAYIAKPRGKPTLVPADDKRPAYNSAAEDFGSPVDDTSNQ